VEAGLLPEIQNQSWMRLKGKFIYSFIHSYIHQWLYSPFVGTVLYQLIPKLDETNVSNTGIKIAVKYEKNLKVILFLKCVLNRF
jgi:hypothetical protein